MFFDLIEFIPDFLDNVLLPWIAEHYEFFIHLL